MTSFRLQLTRLLFFHVLMVLHNQLSTTADDILFSHVLMVLHNQFSTTVDHSVVFSRFNGLA